MKDGLGKVRAAILTAVATTGLACAAVLCFKPAHWYGAAHNLLRSAGCSGPPVCADLAIVPVSRS
jgi:hypothetical protein